MHQLQLRIKFVALGLPLDEVAIALHIPGASVVIEIGAQQLLEAFP